MNKIVFVVIVILIAAGGLLAWKYVPQMMAEPPKLGELPKPDLDIYHEQDIKVLEKHYTENDVFTVTDAKNDGDFVTLQLVYGDIPDGVDFFEIPGQVFSITISKQMYDEVLYGGTIFTGYSFDVREYVVPISANDTSILGRIGGDPGSAEYAQMKEGHAVFSYQHVYSNIYAGEEALSIKEETARILDEINNSDSLRVRHIHLPDDYDLFMAYFGTLQAPKNTPPEEGAQLTGPALEDGQGDPAEQEAATAPEDTTGGGISEGTDNKDSLGQAGAGDPFASSATSASEDGSIINDGEEPLPQE